MRKIQQKYGAALYDLMLVPVAWFLSFWMRFNFEIIPHDILAKAVLLCPLLMIVQVVSFHLFSLYRGLWRYTSLPDLIKIIQGCIVGSLASIVISFMVFRLEGLPRAVVPIYCLLLIAMQGGSRLGFRAFKERRLGLLQGQRVLIVGAGEAGVGLVRDLLNHPEVKFSPVGFVDDNPKKLGRELYGVRVLGECDSIPELVINYDVDSILLALPSANAAQMRRVLGYCQQTRCQVQTLPSVMDLVEGRVSVSALRTLELDDLLGRDAVKLDWEGLKLALSNKSILVTGAGGSIGSELCRQLIKLSPKQLILVDNCEYNLFILQHQLQVSTETECRYHLHTVVDAVAMDALLAQVRPEVVFHAAAYKHVPLLENHCREAVINNVIGTYTVARLAIKHHVGQFVLVSTDKAVNPSNIMGATKRAAEVVCSAFQSLGPTKFTTVRFGNVLGSRGSVVELFRNQIESGGPVKVTHKDVTRFFMTIPEAAQLILQAATLGEGGEVFVLDMGESIKILCLAEQMIKLAGKTIDSISIEYIGLRPGEKMYEELFYDRESLEKTEHPKILKGQASYIQYRVLQEQFERLDLYCKQGDNKAIAQVLFELVPEYQPLGKVAEEQKITKENHEKCSA